MVKKIKGFKHKINLTLELLDDEKNALYYKADNGLWFEKESRINWFKLIQCKTMIGRLNKANQEGTKKHLEELCQKKAI